MSTSFGFIGGGRITKIILKAFSNSNISLSQTIVSDINSEILQNLKSEFPDIKITNNNIEPAKEDILFISLHPPVIAATLNELKPILNDGKIIISLAPKLTLSKLTHLSGGLNNIVRMIPNAPTIVNTGYNPVTFSSKFSSEKKKEITKLFSFLGEFPEVDEPKLEMYAIFTAMGPTYFNFQFFELMKIVEGFGLDCAETKIGITSMLNGIIKMINSNHSTEEILDLVPVKPIGDKEEVIKSYYTEKLIPLFQKIKPE